MHRKPLYSVVRKRNNKRVGKIVRYVTAKITPFNGKTSRFTWFTKKRIRYDRFFILFLFFGIGHKEGRKCTQYNYIFANHVQ